MIWIKKPIYLYACHVSMIFLIKFADVTDVQMLLILIMNKNVTMHPNSSYYQMCISKIQKKYTIIINIMRLF